MRPQPNVSGGVQVSLGADWHGACGARYEKLDSDIDTRAKTDGDYFLFAGALKGCWGDTTLTTVARGLRRFRHDALYQPAGCVLHSEG